MTISVIGPSSSKIILRHLNSNTKSADFDGPQSFHLEHVRKRIEFTVIMFFLISALFFIYNNLDIWIVT